MIETTLIARILAVVRYDAHRRCLRRGQYRDLDGCGNVAGGAQVPELATLARALLRAGFHVHQMPAPVQRVGQRQRGSADPHRVARYLAANSPVERAALQTADITRQLMRGGEFRRHRLTGGGSGSRSKSMRLNFPLSA
jgi:hypothetical protein